MPRVLSLGREKLPSDYKELKFNFIAAKFLRIKPY
jgi:hypothetical protein